MDELLRVGHQIPHDRDQQGNKVLTVAHHKKILDFIKQNFTFRNLGIYISLTTSLRIGEICGLKWSDINTDNGTITVNRTIERIYIVEGKRKHTELVINTPKTKTHAVRYQ